MRTIRSGVGGLVVLCGFDRAWKTRVPQRARRHMAVASLPGRDCGVRRIEGSWDKCNDGFGICRIFDKVSKGVYIRDPTVV